MSYLYVSKKKHQKSPKSLLLTLIALVFIAACLLVWRLSLFSLFTPWWKGETIIMESTATAAHWFGDKGDLVKRVKELEHEKEALEARVLQLQAKSEAYDDLVDEIAGAATEKRMTEPSNDLTASTTATTSEYLLVSTIAVELPVVEGVLAKIIRRPPFTIFDTYIIDKGMKDAITENDIAYAHGMPVGTVQSVTESNATVRMFSSPGEKLLVVIGTSSLQYEAYGIGNGTLRADVPRDALVEIGMEVGAGDRDISLYGTVSAIDKRSNSTSKSVFISLPFKLADTGWLVIRKP